MVDLSPLRDQPVLHGSRVRLEPLTPAVADDYWSALHDPEGRRLTGTHATFTREQVDRWLATRADQHDRADWAVVRADDGAYLGEAVLLDVDVPNEAAAYRVALAGPHVYGQGYGTEVTRLVVAFALDVVGLHRLELEVYEFNARARRAYEKAGFREEGRLREALLWEGARHDVVVMAVLATDPRPPGG